MILVVSLKSAIKEGPGRLQKLPSSHPRPVTKQTLLLSLMHLLCSFYVISSALNY